MKQLLSLSLVAAFILSSCGAKPADTAATTITTPATTTTVAPPAAPTLAEQTADCICTSFEEMAAITKEINAAPEAKKAEIAKKLDAYEKEPACLTALEATIKAIPEAQQAKLDADMKAAMAKKCGAAMKELGM
jgi:hypothetical protein